MINHAFRSKSLLGVGPIWHIDQVKPCASFDLTKDEDIKTCFCWKNIRPLLADENIVKSDKIDKKDIKMQKKYVKEFLSANSEGIVNEKNNIPNKQLKSQINLVSI